MGIFNHSLSVYLGIFPVQSALASNCMFIVGVSVSEHEFKHDRRVNSSCCMIRHSTQWNVWEFWQAVRSPCQYNCSLHLSGWWWCSPGFLCFGNEWNLECEAKTFPFQFPHNVCKPFVKAKKKQTRGMDREEKETVKPLGEGDLSDVDASDDNSASGDDNVISCDDQDDDWWSNDISLRDNQLIYLPNPEHLCIQQSRVHSSICVNVCLQPSIMWQGCFFWLNHYKRPILLISALIEAVHSKHFIDFHKWIRQVCGWSLVVESIIPTVELNWTYVQWELKSIKAGVKCM